MFDTDRLAETTTSVKGETIDAWYSGKRRDFGANIQAVMRPDGLPIWTSDAMPGHLHDLTCAQHFDVTGAPVPGRLAPAPADPGRSIPIHAGPRRQQLT
ncbi:transposase family protein [Salinispora mooreana]|uniref:transposase family protein n=1 Tax=Salinispora mooreana TaxID=999545 RepID=UPI0003796F09|nr:transposase family protein [Salinispora mooreana]